MWTALEIPSEQAAVEFEDRQQIMSTFGAAPPEAVGRVPREAPRRVRRLMSRPVRRQRQDGARDRRLARDRRDDRPRAGRGRRARGHLLAQGGRPEADAQRSWQRSATCEAIPADVSNPDGAEALADGGQRAFPALNILVNNAGATWGAPLEEFPQSGWDRVIGHERRGRLPPDDAAAAGAARGRERRGSRRA